MHPQNRPMSEALGCTACAQFCVDKRLCSVEEWLSWGKLWTRAAERGLLTVINENRSPDRAVMTVTMKCNSCGQQFVATAGLPGGIATWKAIEAFE